MARRRNLSNSSTSLAIKSAELAVAVPQVIAHRLTRMANAGAVPSARDMKEFHRMSAEKTTAFTASWNAMMMQTMAANQALAMSMMRNMLSPTAGSASSMISAATAMQRATLGILGKGLAPVHRTATANARRLGRTKLR
jgi:hypothetical protein